MERQVRPVILTCDRNIALTSVFVWSYLKVRDELAPPIVVIDTSFSPTISATYRKLVDSMRPHSVHVHPRELELDPYWSVNQAAAFCLRVALQESDEELILYLEDDIVFSSQFVAALDSVTVTPSTGFVTLYQPWGGHGAPAIQPGTFFGTQCILLTRRATKELVDNREAVRRRHEPWDFAWSRFLGERGYEIRGTEASYVQHLQAPTRLGEDKTVVHWADTFVR